MNRKCCDCTAHCKGNVDSSVQAEASEDCSDAEENKLQKLIVQHRFEIAAENNVAFDNIVFNSIAMRLV